MFCSWGTVHEEITLLLHTYGRITYGIIVVVIQFESRFSHAGVGTEVLSSDALFSVSSAMSIIRVLSIHQDVPFKLV